MAHNQDIYEVNDYYNDVQAASGSYFSYTHISTANTALVGQWLNIGKIAIVKYKYGSNIRTQIYLIPSQYLLNRFDPNYGVILASSYNPSSPGCVLLNIKDQDDISIYGNEFYRLRCGASRTEHISQDINQILSTLVGNGRAYSLNREFVPGFARSSIGGSLSPLLSLDDAACKSKLKINNAGVIVDENGNPLPLSVQCGNCPFSLNGEYLYGDKETMVDPSTGLQSGYYFAPHFWIGIINTIYAHTLLPPDNTDGVAAFSKLTAYLDELRLTIDGNNIDLRLAYNSSEFSADVTYNANGILNPLDPTETGPIVIVGGIAALATLGLSYPRAYYVSQGLFKEITASIDSIKRTINEISPGSDPDPEGEPMDEDPSSYDDGTCDYCDAGPCKNAECDCRCDDGEIDASDMEKDDQGKFVKPIWYLENGVYHFGKVTVDPTGEKRTVTCEAYEFEAVIPGLGHDCSEGECTGECAYDMEKIIYCPAKEIECYRDGGGEGIPQSLYSEGKSTSCAVEYNVNGNIFYVRR